MTIKKRTIHAFGFGIVLAAVVVATAILHNDNKNYAMKLEQMRTDSSAVLAQGIGQEPVRTRGREVPGKGDKDMLRRIAAELLQPDVSPTPSFPAPKWVNWKEQP
jgi:hypothetical protein